jgi:peptidoglycan/LPS O-acetylase OafA/YrhL
MPISLCKESQQKGERRLMNQPVEVKRDPAPPVVKAEGRRNLALPVGTLLLGLILLIQSFVPDTGFNYIFPTIILLVGAIMLLIAVRRKQSGFDRFIPSLVVLIVGLLLLLRTLGVMAGDWIDPVIILLLGIAMFRY